MRPKRVFHLLKSSFLLSGVIFTSQAFAETKSTPICKTHQTPIRVFAKDDMVFQHDDCNDDANDDRYILEYLQKNDEKLFLFKKEEGYGYEPPKVEAVSIFKPKIKSKPPVLIVLHGQYNCCYPRPSGTFYDIKLFQIFDNQGKLETKDITSILGDNDSGFEGQIDRPEKSHYSLKTISAIKKWLTKHY